MKESEKINKYLGLAFEVKAVEHNVNGHTNYNLCAWDSPQGLKKKSEWIEDQGEG